MAAAGLAATGRNGRLAGSAAEAQWSATKRNMAHMMMERRIKRGSREIREMAPRHPEQQVQTSAHHPTLHNKGTHTYCANTSQKKIQHFTDHPVLCYPVSTAFSDSRLLRTAHCFIPV